MSNRLSQLPAYLYGSAHFAAPECCVPLPGYDGTARYEVPRHGAPTISSAIASAQYAQPRLADLTVADVQRVLARLADRYLATPDHLARIVELTGSNMAFVREGIALVKDWVRHLDTYLAIALPDADARYQPSAPVVLVLPSNDSQEALFCLAQILLSRNACIVRPSGRGASAYLATEFVAALLQTLEDLADPRLEILRMAVSVIHTEADSYLEPLAMEGWNYIFFGDSATGKRVTQTLLDHCQPRKILVYGTGLSMTVFGQSGDLTAHLKEIVDSVTVNAGNECISTDILYVPAKRQAEVCAALTAMVEQQRAGDPFDETAVGYVRVENVSFILGELTRKGKVSSARVEVNNGRPTLHPSVVFLTDYDIPIEYPGPVVSVRSFDNLDHLEELIARDLANNDMPHNLVTAVFADDPAEVDAILPRLRSHVIKINLPTHHFDCNQPHQGIFLLRELVRPVYVFTR